MASFSRVAFLALSFLAPTAAFVAPPTQHPATSAPALVAAETVTGAADEGSQAGPAGAQLALAAGALGVAAGLLGKRRPTQEARTQAKYTTKKVLPAFQWLKSGVKTGMLAPGQVIARTLGGNDVLIGKNQSGSLFCVGNICPHLGTPMSEGAEVKGDSIICPLHGSTFNIKTGKLLEWCPSPPVLGPLTGLIAEQTNLAVFNVRTSFLGDDIEVNVDTNAKKAYEADYWKGLLDAQGKVDGSYY